MHVSINIPFKSVQELSAILAQFQKDLILGGEVTTETPKVEVKQKPEPAPTPEVKSKKKAAPLPETVVTSDTQKVSEAPKTPTVDKLGVTSALQILNNKKGLPAARAVLAKFKNDKNLPCQRLSELSEKDYVSFYEICMAEAESV